MADAAADFNTSMFSTSFGLRSAKRLTTWSCEELRLPPARVTELAPDEIDALETMMPSTT